MILKITTGLGRMGLEWISSLTPESPVLRRPFGTPLIRGTRPGCVAGTATPQITPCSVTWH